ncbi:hypothetical protein GCM10009092_04960 [Bowmanella denitrificans]|uniref:HTH araC/xylS-type domain-containing protein n=1 Tax=Bowmanella denitrificans TaxID=366582 RepID=A0ABP3GED2_9ALTE
MAIQLLEIITTFAFTLCFSMVAVLAWLPGIDKTEHRYLQLYLAAIGVILLIDQLTPVHHALHLSLPPLLFMLGPLLFAYTRQQCRLPLSGAILGFLLIPSLVLSLLLVLQWLQLMSWSSVMHLSLLYWYAAYEMLFTLLSLECLRHFSQQDKDSQGANLRTRLLWLKGYCWFNLLLLSVDLISPWWWAAYAPGLPVRSLSLCILTVALIWFGLTLVRKPHLLLLDHLRQVAKYRHSGLRPDSQRYYKQKLDSLMQTQKIFLDPELSLASLATQVGLNSHNLSQLLNESCAQSFYDYLNAYRIAHAQQQLLCSDASVVDVAMASGFNNKASFYKAFRKQCGMTPTQWRQQALTTNHQES